MFIIRASLLQAGRIIDGMVKMDSPIPEIESAQQPDIDIEDQQKEVTNDFSNHEVMEIEPKPEPEKAAVAVEAIPTTEEALKAVRAIIRFIESQDVTTTKQL